MKKIKELIRKLIDIPVQLWRYYEPHLIICTFILVFMVLLLWPRIVYVVNSGQAGVLFRTLGEGTVLDQTYSEGVNLVNPINEFFVYDLRIQERQIKVPVLSKNGLTILVDTTYRYKPIYKELPLLHKEIGPEYERKIIIPAIFSSVREVVGKYQPAEIYTTHRITIQDEAFMEAQEEVKDKHVVLDNVIVRSIKLPDVINNAIETKLRQEQLFEEYKFRIQKEEKEAERKRIEAGGIRDFQEIVQENITDKLLVWRGIEATRLLAESENAKVVVIGNSKEGLGLPIIMGNTSPNVKITATDEKQAKMLADRLKVLSADNKLESDQRKKLKEIPSGEKNNELPSVPEDKVEK